MTEEELISRVNEGLKRPLEKDDIFCSYIKLNHLKRVDKIFNKGLNFYLDPTDIDPKGETSIFLRKNEFNADLNWGARDIVIKYEELKLTLSAISKLANIKQVRTLPVYNTADDPLQVAFAMRDKLYPIFNNNKRSFLKALIESFAEHNILVFEFIENWNKKNKANIDGFFLTENFIVLKRQQKAFRREIFTLAHELGHFILNKEEVDKTDFTTAITNSSTVERWCNDFAFAFLAGDYINTLNNLGYASANNDYFLQIVEEISKQTHLSRLAIYTWLLLNKKISYNSYNNIRNDFDEQYKLQKEKEERQKELDKLTDKKRPFAHSKPIVSPLYTSTIQSAYFEGVIGEFEVCKFLNIKPEKLYDYI